MRKISILVIDEEGLLRDGICALLNSEGYGEVACILGDGASIAAAAVPIDPDLVVMDLFATGDDAGDAIAVIRRRWEKARVLVLTFHREDRIIESALRAGADGYVLKTDTRLELSTAIRTIMDGKRYVSNSIFDRVVSGYVRKHSLARERSEDGLSGREREVMMRIARGYRTREIADQLSLSQKTIEKHRSNLMRKLGLRTATAVVAYAISHGYLDGGGRGSADQ